MPKSSTTSNDHRDKLTKSSLTCQQLAERLVRSGVISKEQMQEFWKKLTDERRKVVAFADALVAQNLCTSYQLLAAADQEKPLLKVGSYLIVDKIGEGGMGQVFRAVHQKMKREVALKVLSNRTSGDSQAAQRFTREVEAAARLSHKNIVTAYDAGDENGMPYLVMEYVVGTDLSSIVKKTGPLSVELAIGYIAQAARGFSYAHRQGIVHRDVKPANLLLDHAGTVKILDMGLARFELEQETNSAAGLTATGVMMGTVDYVSPEQAFDPKLADARSDIYSLGCALYFLLTGEAPYKGDTLFKRILSHKEAPIPNIKEKLPDVPDWVQTVFERMVAKSPDDRFRTMDEVVATLEELTNASSDTTAGDAFARTIDHVRIRDAKSTSGNTVDRTAGSDSTAPGRGGKATISSPLTSADFQKISEINIASSQSSGSQSQSQRIRLKQTKPAILYAIAALVATVLLGGGLAFWLLRPAKAQLLLEFSQPELSGATVTIDGKPAMTLQKGEGQYAFELRRDGKEHQVAVAKKGFANFEQSFDFSEGPEASIVVKLSAASAPPSQVATNANPKSNSAQPPKQPDPPPSGLGGALNPDLANNDPNASAPGVKPTGNSGSDLTIDPPNLNPSGSSTEKPPANTNPREARTLIVGLGKDELPDINIAIQRARAGDTILIRHRGPLEIAPTDLSGKTPLTIKGDTQDGIDFWPILRQTIVHWENPRLKDTFPGWFFGSNIDLTFEKVHLGFGGPLRQRVDAGFRAESGNVTFTNCTVTAATSGAIDCFENDRIPLVRMDGSESSVFQVKFDHCVIRGGRLGPAIRCDGKTIANIEANNLLWAGGFDSWFEAEGSGPHSLNLTNSTLLGMQSLASLAESALSSTAEPALKLATKDCILLGAYMNPSTLFRVKSNPGSVPEVEQFAKGVTWQASDVVLHQLLPKAKGANKSTALKSLATAFNLPVETLSDADPGFRVRPAAPEMQDIDARDFQVNHRNIKNLSATIGVVIDELPPVLAGLVEHATEPESLSKPRGKPRILQVNKKNGPFRSLEEAFAKLGEDDIIEITDSSTYFPKQNFGLTSKLGVLHVDQFGHFCMRAKEGAEPVIVLRDVEQDGALPKLDDNSPSLILFHLNCVSVKLDGLRFRAAMQRQTSHSFIHTTATALRITNCSFLDVSAAPHATVFPQQNNGLAIILPGNWQPSPRNYQASNVSVWIENTVYMRPRPPSSLTIGKTVRSLETAINVRGARQITLRNSTFGTNVFALLSQNDGMESIRFENCTVFGRPLFVSKIERERQLPVVEFSENLILAPDNPIRFDKGGLVDQITPTGRDNALWLADGRLTPQTRNTDSLKLIPGPVMKLPPPYMNGIDVPADDKDKDAIAKQLKLKSNQDAGKMAPDGGPVGMRFDRLP